MLNWIKKNKLSKSLEEDNKMTISEIGKNSFINNLFVIQTVRRRKIWTREENKKVQILKIKQSAIRIGYAIEWNSNKKYEEIVINLKNFNPMTTDELIGVEKYFLFKEYSDWRWQAIEKLVQDSNDSLNLILKSDKAPLLIPTFNLYKFRIESSTDEEYI